jgi:hypothetical protein
MARVHWFNEMGLDLTKLFAVLETSQFPNFKTIMSFPQKVITNEEKINSNLNFALINGNLFQNLQLLLDLPAEEEFSNGFTVDDFKSNFTNLRDLKIEHESHLNNLHGEEPFTGIE